jgi:TonB-dependent starch-binding outer membrane protein SusC
MNQLLALRVSLRFLPIIFIFLISSFGSYGQEKKVSGKVTDENGAPLDNVSVAVKGQTKGTVTDADGLYSINVPGDNTVLVFSYAGYVNQEMNTLGKTSINLQLAPDVRKTALQEVVVIGYGTQKKRDLTGSIGSVSRKDFANKPFTSPDQILGGRIAGVNITNRSGDPGAPIEVRIRGIGTAGNNQPLWIIDGVPVATNTSTITVNTSSATETNPLAGINPSDIESIDVLKDASATAIYGARANNGVILVTTKRGKAGAAVVSYDGYVGVQAIPKNKLFKVLNTDEYIKYQKDGFNNNDFIGFAGKPTVDWQDLVYRKGPATSHNLTISGGSQNATYSFGAGYFKQKGIQIGQGFTRFSAKATSDVKIGKYFKFGESLLLSRIERNTQSEEFANAGAGATRNVPFFQPYTSTGEYNPANKTTTGDGTAQNFLWYADPSVGYTNMKSNKILGSLYGEVEIISGLKYKATIGLDYNEATGIYFQGPVDFSGISGPRESLIVNEQPKEATLSMGHTLTYDKTFGKNKITALIGYEQTSYLLRRLRVQASKLFNPPLGLAGGAGTFGSSETADHWNIQGKLARLFYSYNDRYLLTATIREDKSTRFPKANNTGYFPSFALGWRLTEERFLKDSKLFNDLKLRIGWGQSGNQFTGTNFSYLPALSSFVKYVVGKGDQTIVTGYAPVLKENPDLKWETAIQTNIGLDFTMLNYKLSGSFDYFSRTTQDLLISVPVPLSLGFFQFSDLNSGTLNNKGIEFTANYRDKIGSLSYNIGGNFTFVKNEFTKLPDGIDYIQLNDKRISVGRALGYFYGYKTNGIYQTDAEVPATDGYKDAKAGDIKFVDVNGDKKLTDDDRTFLGSPIPKFYYGLNLGANYKEFDLSIVLQGVGNYTVYDGPRAGLESMTNTDNQSVTVLNRWTATNKTNTMFRAKSDFNTNKFSDWFLENAAFLRVKNLQLGYSIKGISTLTKRNISYARFYIGVSNLFTFTKYKGYDPEVTRQQSFAGGENQFLNGYDNGNAPQPRMFQFGWQINF